MGVGYLKSLSHSPVIGWGRAPIHYGRYIDFPCWVMFILLTSIVWRVTPHMWHQSCYTYHVTCHIIRVTSIVWRVTSLVSLLTLTSWWRSEYKWPETPLTGGRSINPLKLWRVGWKSHSFPFLLNLLRNYVILGYSAKRPDSDLQVWGPGKTPIFPFFDPPWPFLSTDLQIIKKFRQLSVANWG